MFFEITFQIFNTLFLLLMIASVILFLVVLLKLNTALNIWIAEHKQKEKGSSHEIYKKNG